MSVKISTKEKLNSNLYNSMIIREVDGNFFVKVNGKKSNDEYQFVGERLTDSLKEMSDEQKIIYIVDSFLENATINEIELNALNLGYKGQFIKISGSRTLYLQISNIELFKSLVKMIKMKYDIDRYKYEADYNGNLYSINLREKIVSYDVKFISCDDCSLDCSGGYCPKHLEFNIMYINGKIAGFDKKFIERFIYDKLYESRCNATIVEETNDIKLIDGTKIDSYTKCYNIICGNLEIRFNCSAFTRDFVFEFCNEIVNEYNSELDKINKQRNECKKRQLKMEGF